MPSDPRETRIFQGLLVRRWSLRLGLVVVLACLWSPHPVAGQDQSDPGTPSVLASLEGVWVGEGVLMNRPAAFRMEWELRPGGFARLSFSNAWVGEGDQTIPVLSAEATYLMRGSTAVGVWVDNRPQQLTLGASLSDSTFVTEWVAEAEEGRTEYVVQASDRVLVRDFVLVEGALQLFAEATYRREAPEGLE